MKIVLFLLFLNAFLFAQVDTLFTRVFRGAGANEDSLTGMVIDSRGYIYLTGFLYTSEINIEDYFTVKMTKDGIIKWVRTYNGTADEFDCANAIAVDSSGSVYVTGISHDAVNGNEITTVKYDSLGNQIWVRSHHNFSGDIDDGGVCIHVDQEGFVYVAGFTGDTNLLNTDYCLIKYNPVDGSLMWVRYYNLLPENERDIPVGMAIDDSANIYLTGYSYSSIRDYDYATLKYSKDGALRWIRRYNYSPANSGDFPVAILFDSQTSSIYVTGYSDGDVTADDWLTIRYNRRGDTIWTRRYNRSPDNDEDKPTSLLSDALGNIYVGGYSWDSDSDFDFCIIKYTPAGVIERITRYNGPGNNGDFLYGLAIDSIGNIYAVGSVYLDAQVYSDLACLKFSPAGSLIWNTFYHYGNVRDEEIAIFCQVKSNACFVSGMKVGDTTGIDIVFLKYYEPQYDMATYAILSPPDTVIQRTPITPTAVVKNLGVRSCTAKVYFQIDNFYLDSLNISLVSGQIETLDFRIWIPESIGNFLVKCSAALRGDVNPRNDKQTKIVNVQPLVAVFENPSLKPKKRLTFSTLIRNEPIVLSPNSTIKIYSLTGKLIKEERVKNLSKKVLLSNLACGTYFIRIEGEIDLKQKIVLVK